MNVQQDLELLEITSNPVTRLLDRCIDELTVPESRLNPGLKAILCVLAAQVLVVVAGAALYGVTIGRFDV